MKKLLMLTLLALASMLASAAERSSAVTYQFRKDNACPATGKIQRTCLGYVIDHVVPLCAGGPDTAHNLMWQTRADSYRKDVMERDICKRLRQCENPVVK